MNIVIIICVISIIIILYYLLFILKKENFDLGDLVEQQDNIDRQENQKNLNEFQKKFKGTTNSILNNLYNVAIDPFYYSKILGEKWQSYTQMDPNNELVRRAIPFDKPPIKDNTKENFLIDTPTSFQIYLRDNFYYKPSPRNNMPGQKGMYY